MSGHYVLKHYSFFENARLSTYLHTFFTGEIDLNKYKEIHELLNVIENREEKQLFPECEFLTKKNASCSNFSYELLLRYPMFIFSTLCYIYTSVTLRACLHGGGGPQVVEVTRLAVVEKWPGFT